MNTINTSNIDVYENVLDKIKDEKSEPVVMNEYERGDNALDNTCLDEKTFVPVNIGYNDGPKYEFTGETKPNGGKVLRRIRAARDIYFPDGHLFVKKGELGGWIEKEENLSHEGSCWVGENGIVCDDAIVSGEAYVYGRAIVAQNAVVTGDAVVRGHALVTGDAVVYDEAYIHSCATVDCFARVCANANVGGIATVSGYTSIGKDCTIGGNARLWDDETYEEVTINE